MFLFGIHPSSHLIEILGRHVGAQFIDLYHGFANRCACFTNGGHQFGVVKNTTGDLAMPTTKSQDQMKGGFFLDV